MIDSDFLDELGILHGDADSHRQPLADPIGGSWVKVQRQEVCALRVIASRPGPIIIKGTARVGVEAEPQLDIWGQTIRSVTSRERRKGLRVEEEKNPLQLFDFSTF